MTQEEKLLSEVIKSRQEYEEYKKLYDIVLNGFLFNFKETVMETVLLTRNT